MHALIKLDDVWFSIDLSEMNEEQVKKFKKVFDDSNEPCLLFDTIEEASKSLNIDISTIEIIDDVLFTASNVK